MRKFYFVLFSLVIVRFNAQLPTYVPTTSLVAWYSFNGNSNDLSGNSNALTAVNGASLSVDRCGAVNNAYSLDGINDWLETTTNFYNPSIPHTISIWWKTTDSVKTDQTLFNTNPHTIENLAFRYNGTTTPPYGLSYGLGDGSVGSWTVMHPNSGQYSITPNFSKWRHSVCVRNSTAWEFYQDGVLTFTFSTGSYTPPSNATIRFGAENNVSTGGAQFKGSIDDIGIWNRALTPTEVAALYNACGVGINEFNLVTQLNIYPNPATKTLYIENPSNTKIELVTILDITGRKVLEKNEDAGQINIDALEVGLYEVIIVSEGKRYSSKLVKQ